MKRLLVAALALAACGGGDLAAEGGIAAATFLVEGAATDFEVVGVDRAAGRGDENRLDVVRPTVTARRIDLYPSAPVPEPFEFVRDPLAAGGIDRMLVSAERVVAVVHPLIDRTPNGRVLTGSLVAIGADGTVVGTDWDDGSDAAVRELVAWGRENGWDPLTTLELAAAGLRDPTAAGDARTAADFLG